jgi:hypothetical protein
MIYRLPDKQPGETIKGIYIDFASKLLTGETITTGSVTGSVTGVVQNVQTVGSKIVWDVTGGADRDAVKITIVATGSLGSIREANALLMIKEIA